MSIMSRPRNRIAEIAARVRRVERKCNSIIAEISALRNAMSPVPTEMDEVIGRLRRTAAELRRQSVAERVALTGNS